MPRGGRERPDGETVNLNAGYARIRFTPQSVSAQAAADATTCELGTHTALIIGGQTGYSTVKGMEVEYYQPSTSTIPYIDGASVASGDWALDAVAASGTESDRYYVIKQFTNSDASNDMLVYRVFLTKCDPATSSCIGYDGSTGELIGNYMFKQTLNQNVGPKTAYRIKYTVWLTIDTTGADVTVDPNTNASAWLTEVLKTLLGLGSRGSFNRAVLYLADGSTATVSGSSFSVSVSGTQVTWSMDYQPSADVGLTAVELQYFDSATNSVAYRVKFNLNTSTTLVGGATNTIQLTLNCGC